MFFGGRRSKIAGQLSDAMMTVEATTSATPTGVVVVERHSGGGGR
jgi:hypothetical protein